jgi:predicted N-formylglutamate amidohydrolase
VLTGFVVSVEHATNRVPARYRKLFASAGKALDSHRGWDRGARSLGASLARGLGAPLFVASVSRLVIDTNRSLGNRGCFSEWTRRLESNEREALVARYWEPFRSATRTAIAGMVRSNARVVHVSCHSFTPVFGGKVRSVDVGLLFDPARKAERALAERVRAALAKELPALRARFNQPYRGVTDGHTASLRRELRARDYLGLELEVSQAIVANPRSFRALRRALVHALSRSAPG